MTSWAYCDSRGSGRMERDRWISTNEPIPTATQNGFGLRKYDKWWLVTDGLPETPPADAPGKPPYRIPLMGEIAAVAGNGLTVASTFSGCGGSCLGFRMAGYRTVYASEFIPAAADTYEANHPGVPVDRRDIREVTGADILRIAGVEAVDVLEGSPPCASFSTAGRRSEHWGQVKSYSDTKQRTDDLFYEYARILGELQPRVFVAENVAGLVKGVAKGYFKRIHAALREKGYRVEARVLDAQWLGVPQMRSRVIFVGIRDDLNVDPVFPAPLPYRYSIRDALPWVGGFTHDLGPNSTAYGGKPRVMDVDRDPAPTITVGTMNSVHYQVEVGAGGTEEEVVGHVSGDFAQRKRNLNEPAGTIPASIQGQKHPGLIVRVGVDEPEGDGPSLDGYAVGKEWDRTRPGSKSDRYINLVRPKVGAPSPTVTAIGGRSPGTASVTHPTEKRKFTIAELRRLCGFPDDFVLTGTYAQQWERLGRAVPPPMMYAVAREIEGLLLRPGDATPDPSAAGITQADPVAAEWREKLLEVVSPYAKLPLLLSGGMDSTSLLAAQVALGERPDCYAFRIGDADTPDVEAARALAHRYDLRLTVVAVPRDRLEDDVREIVAALGTGRKTAVQCAHPLLYLARAVAADGHASALVGTGGIVEDNRRVMVALAAEGEDAARGIRRENLLGWKGTDNGTWAMHRIAELSGVLLVEPLAHQPLADYGLSLTVAEINRPVQKGIAVRAFPELFVPEGGNRYRHARQNSPLQVGSLLREWHDELLTSPLNTRGARRVVAIYNDLLREATT